MPKSGAAKRPPIHLIDVEADALSGLAYSAEKLAPDVSKLLLEEILRAKVLKAERIPKDVVTMRATVKYRDEANGTARWVQLVYPREADIVQGRISILTLIGAGLVGLREGQSILWPDRDGQERLLTVIKVVQGDQLEAPQVEAKPLRAEGLSTLPEPATEQQTGIDVIIQIEIDRRQPGYRARFEEAVLNWPNLRECLLLSNDMNYSLRLCLKSVGEYEHVKSGMLANLPGIRKLTANFVVSDLLRRREHQG